MSAYSAAVLADVPDVYYRLNQSSGTSIADSSGNGHTLTANAAISGAAAGLLPADSDTAILFDYTANAPTSAATAYSVAQDNMTVEFWIKLASLTTSDGLGVVAACGSSNGWAAYFDGVTGVWNYGKKFVAGYTFTGAVAAGVAQHVVFAITNAAGGSVSLYINGVFSQTVTNAGSATLASTDRFEIANNTNTGAGAGHNIHGVIDELAIYKSQLTPTRIAAHYAAASQGAAGLHALALLGVGS